MALTVLQPPTTGKALKTRPAYKGMLRAKLPELCGIGALFRWLAMRFTVLAEPIPQPGTPQFNNFFLWGATGRRNGGLCHVCFQLVMCVFNLPSMQGVHYLWAEGMSA